MVIGNIQLGKNKITENFILSLKNQFKKHNLIKIHVLKSARESGKKGKQEVKEYLNEILKTLGKKYTGRVIGFTIVVKKWRKARE